MAIHSPGGVSFLLPEQRQILLLGEGNQNDLRLYFGLGPHKEPVTAEITWPGAGKQTRKGLALNRQHRIDFNGDGK